MTAPNKTAKQQLGNRGETAAARLLVSKRYEILDSNWRRGRMELDLVCRDRDEIVFVEVKTRSAGVMTTPADGMDPRKIRNMVKAATRWLNEHEAWKCACRFDVVCVTDTGQELRCEHHPNAFETAGALACRNAAWQPW